MPKMRKPNSGLEDFLRRRKAPAGAIKNTGSLPRVGRPGFGGGATAGAPIAGPNDRKEYMRKKRPPARAQAAGRRWS